MGAYLRFHRRWFYLATVIDISTREILAWTLGNQHTKSLVMDALYDALKNREKVPNIFHSDHGSEYTSKECEGFLLRRGVSLSHAQKGKPWKNGFQESFYGKFKKELGDINRFKKTDQLFGAMSSLIHYYNTKRIHTALKMSPREYYLKKRYQETTPSLTYPQEISLILEGS
jgi:transposase InsO family protein